MRLAAHPEIQFLYSLAHIGSSILAKLIIIIELSAKTPRFLTAIKESTCFEKISKKHPNPDVYISDNLVIYS